MSLALPHRVFAVIPAAGESRRMGEPKLLMPWNNGTVMDSVLEAWCQSDVDVVVVVVRESDTTLQRVCSQWPVEVVRPPHTADMKASVACGLRHVLEKHSPTASDQWMIAPADLPRLNSSLINRILTAGKDVDQVVAPRFGTRQGHPVLLPWALSHDVFELGDDEGIDRLLVRQEIFHVDLPAESRVQDVDTPEDFRRI